MSGLRVVTFMILAISGAFGGTAKFRSLADAVMSVVSKVTLFLSSMVSVNCGRAVLGMVSFGKISTA